MLPRSKRALPPPAIIDCFACRDEEPGRVDQGVGGNFLAASMSFSTCSRRASKVGNLCSSRRRDLKRTSMGPEVSVFEKPKRFDSIESDWPSKVGRTPTLVTDW